MNVYFINPCYLNSETFPIFLEILKIKEVINLCDLKTRNENILKLCRNILIYDRKDTKETDALKQAVYKFNEPMCKPIITDGAFTGKFEMHYLYEKSNAMNPIYNLEHCNDKNILILTDDKLNVTNFKNHSFNIMQKYDNRNYHNYYKERICFALIDSLLTFSWVNGFRGLSNTRGWISKDYSYENEILLKKGTSYNYELFRNTINKRGTCFTFITTINPRTNEELLINTFINNKFNPLISYLALKTKKNRNNMDIYSYFLTKEGVDKHMGIIDINLQNAIKTIRKENYNIYYDTLSANEIPPF